jgi:hypothetical protein
MAENLILNPTRFISGVFANHEEDLPLRNQSSKDKSS